MYDINESGEAVGSGETNTPGFTRAIRWEAGGLTNLGGNYYEARSAASSINDAGDIVGVSDISNYEPGHPFLLRDGKMIPLGTGYGSGSGGSPRAINNAREIVGERRPGGSAPSRGFLWRNGAYVDLGSLGGIGSAYNVTTTAEDINDRAQIVGSSVPAKGYPLYPFLWENGKMRDLGALGPDTEAT